MRTVVLTLLLLFGAGPPLHAEEGSAGDGSPFRVNLAVDLPLTISGAAVGLMLDVLRDERGGPSCGTACDPARVNALDRTVIGNHAPPAALASDLLLGTSIGLPFALDLLDVLITRPGATTRLRLAGYGKDALVLLETLSLDYLLTNVIKHAVRRPRPLVYDAALGDDERTRGDAALSFYSGHASISFAMATSYSYLFTLRHPRSKLIAPVWIATHCLAAVTAYLRVHAGKHFWTDILTGAAVGSGVGLLVPALHRLPLPGVRLSPLLMPGGAGVMLSVE